MFNPFKKKSAVEKSVEKMVDSAYDAGKIAAKVVGTCAIGTLYGIGAIVLAAGEVAAEDARRREEARQEAREARRIANEAEVRAQAAERKAYGFSVDSNGNVESRHRYTSSNGIVYEVTRRYTGMCNYEVIVRRYYSGKVVRIEDAYGLSAAISCERNFADEIRRGYMD